jgi:DNA repair protein RecO (recombination protein O)
MEETFFTKAFIIRREPWRERDSRIVVYTLERGKLELVARGTKKLLSKLASHIEPITLADLMVVKGRQVDYVGSAVSQENFRAIKTDLEKIFIVGEILNQFNHLVKLNESDPKIFLLLRNWLFATNEKNITGFQIRLQAAIFKILLVSELGQGIEINRCQKCSQPLNVNENWFNTKLGGVCCVTCHGKNPDKNGLLLMPETMKLLKSIFTNQNNLNVFFLKSSSMVAKNVEILANLCVELANQ